MHKYMPCNYFGLQRFFKKCGRIVVLTHIYIKRAVRRYLVNAPPQIKKVRYFCVDESGSATATGSIVTSHRFFGQLDFLIFAFSGSAGRTYECSKKWLQVVVSSEDA